MKNPIFHANGIILISLLLSALFCLPVEAREDSARLVFQKTADIKKTLIYVVKKGDILGGILRRHRGEHRKLASYNLIRRLNPGIRDLNRIYPGQKIVLPVREPSALPELPSDFRKKSDSPPPNYGIKEKDRPPASESLPPAVQPLENARSETAMKTPPTAEHILGIIRPVVHRMKGTLIARGNYFIPLKEATQITIDCSLIPVVELDEGTTVLLDFGNRLSEDIKALIGQTWKNYAFVPGEELGDGLTGLKGIIRRSRNYEMSDVGSPLVLLPKPEIRVFPDWTITAKTTAVGASYRQALFLLGSNEKPLPGEARSFLEKNGLVVTEISGDRAVTGPVLLKATPVTTDLRGLKGIALAEPLLKALGETPVASSEIVLFDQARNGFHLSITADLLIRRAERRFVIHTKRLPEQFVRIMKEGGTEVIPIEEGASGRPLIEGLLQGLRIPVSFGHFSFRIPEDGNRPRLTATFPALRAMSGGEPIYLFDFDMLPDVQAFLNGLTGGRIAKY
ncbi:MAG TPA: hypothetical protein DCZ97_16455 [Syntrophus sp. (in: bacteria)]|nr:hypothetical protein [Syntrophus sp. (in: bacteria)]